MLKIAAFADEISPDINEQIKVCKANSVTHFELRGVAGKNVLDFDDALKNEVKSKLSANGMGVISIGSPIGKVAIDQPWDKHFDRFKIAVDMAEFFNAPYIRLFSYYPAGGEGKGPTDGIKDEVIKRFNQKVEYLKGRKPIMVHENEKGIYGDIGRRFIERKQPSLEAQLANLADEIAYNNHDIDDGLRSGLITTTQLDEVDFYARHLSEVARAYPGITGRRAIHETIRRMINALAVDLIQTSQSHIRDAGVQSIDEVRNAAALIRFVARSAGEPDPDADRPHVRHRLGDEPQAVVQDLACNHS